MNDILPPIPPKSPQQLIEDAMQLYLQSVSDALGKAGNPEHILVLKTTIALPDGKAFELTGELKAKAPVEQLNPFVSAQSKWDKISKVQ